MRLAPTGEFRVTRAGLKTRAPGGVARRRVNIEGARRTLNLLPGVESIYRWEGKVERAGEVLAVIKTTRYPELEAALKELHPYEVPEILALPVAAGLAGYLAWLGESCGAG